MIRLTPKDISHIFLRRKLSAVLSPCPSPSSSFLSPSAFFSLSSGLLRSGARPEPLCLAVLCFLVAALAALVAPEPITSCSQDTERETQWFCPFQRQVFLFFKSFLHLLLFVCLGLFSPDLLNNFDFFFSLLQLFSSIPCEQVDLFPVPHSSFTFILLVCVCLIL